MRMVARLTYIRPDVQKQLSALKRLCCHCVHKSSTSVRVLSINIKISNGF